MENPISNLYYALGEACYAIAFSDGSIQLEEKNKLSEILKKEFANSETKDIDETSIIFQILNKERISSETAMNWAINTIKINSHYLSTDLKCHFISTIIKVADSFSPITKDEKKMLLAFISEVVDINEDKLLSKPTFDK